MNKLSKLTALLLALVLALSVPMQVMAESAEIETKTEYYEVADKILQAKIMAYVAYGEYWDMAKLITEEDFEEFYYGLSEADQLAMAEYVEAMFWDSLISYTRVAPFVTINNDAQPASTFSVQARDIATVADTTTDNGLYTNKTVSETPDENGYYTITLENYVTGKVTTTTTTKTVPVDIVLVLDFSNSMSQSFDGSGGNGSSSNSKIIGLQTAVNNFIQSVNDNYTDEGNHRISLITYNTNATVRNGWTYVTDANVSGLQISNTERSDWQSSGTNTHLGLSAALNQLNNSSISGSTVTRQKVVILFTDGVPGTSRNEFVESAAVSAVTNAYSIKDTGATVYSVAVLNGADPLKDIDTSATTDETKINAMLHAISSNYEDATASYSGDTLTTTLGDFNSAIDTDGNGKLTDGEDSYYISASSATELNNIFQKISTNIQSGSASVTLDETTIVRDEVTPYFEIPYVLNEDGTKDYTAAKITIQEAVHTSDDSNGNPLFGTPTDADYSYTVDGNVLDVTGFDFADNAVMTVNGVAQGKKLIITFKIKAVDGFLGGNDVVTNTSNSGVWEKQEDGTYTEFEAYPIPDVNVDVPQLEIVGADQYIYLSNLADLDALLHSFQVQYWIQEGDDKYGIYTVDTILNHYTKLTFTLTDQTGTEVATYTINAGEQKGTWHYNTEDYPSLQLALTEDTTYTVSYVAESANNSANNSTGTLTAHVYVYKPIVTFADTRHRYMEELDAETVTDYYVDENYVLEQWYNQGTNKYSTDVLVMNGPKPDLTFTFDPGAVTDKVVTVQNDGSGNVTTTVCVPVDITKVTATSTYTTSTTAEDGTITETKTPYTMDVTNVVTSYRNEIDCDCEHDAAAVVAPATLPATKVGDNSIEEFVVHVYDVTGSLQITKTVQNNTIYASEMTDDAFEFTVTLTGENIPDTVSYKIGENVYPNVPVNDGKFTVTLKNGESALISDIVSGIQYSVAETKKTGYTIQYDEYQSGTIAAQQTQATVVTNTYTVGSLTIKKEGMAQGETAIFTVTGDGKTYTVAITMGADGKGSATIGQLKLDTSYTVAEMTDWSWRYTSSLNDGTLPVTITEAKNYAVSFKNEKKTDKWLSDESSIVNFDGSNK